ncbi:sensor histidine kinase [Phytomonospora endophytica]|uniref:histidine kinase n=1 Tax=Phytomonospora endophytica TaxID=714109 RepID=A0A841FZ67_9ACTN|nr:ATP-binding protein [Phytomonospora endophytica]MBB6037240.1 signal transduction histidine kinase [Phytomonospora endophytica]GIG71260.1 two-component sensor histidine kinase [Phytomonospora endophytica]
MRRWRWATASAGLVVLVGGLVLFPAPARSVLAPFAACLAVLGVWATWPRSRAVAPYVGMVVGVLSLAVTAVHLAVFERGGEPGRNEGLWMLLEPVVTVVFVYLPVRWSPPRLAVLGGSLPAVGVAASVQRYMPGDELWEHVAGSLLWLLPSLIAGILAWYMRGVDTARERAVAEARHAQRLDLAGDLHDFVAHDVSEMVAQAQAVRMVLANGDPRLEEALERIEKAGLRALESMDRTVHMLRDAGEAAREPVGGLADLPGLVERFADGGRTRATLSAAVIPGVPREAAAVAYRVVVEALTNVRRHAPHASTVDVELALADGALRVTVTDDGTGEPRQSPRAHAGLGLPGLTERVEALRGSLDAGPHRPHGWRLTATIPLTADQE